jgi:hypothetical protein
VICLALQILSPNRDTAGMARKLVMAGRDKFRR